MNRTLDTNSRKFPRLRVGVNLFIKNELYAIPDAVDFGEVSAAQLTEHPEMVDGLSQSFLLKRRAGKFSITSTQCDVAAIRITQTPEGDSGTFRIQAELVADKLRPGSLTGEIRLKTTDNQFPEVMVPVRGTVK